MDQDLYLKTTDLKMTERIFKALVKNAGTDKEKSEDAFMLPAKQTYGMWVYSWVLAVKTLPC